MKFSIDTDKNTISVDGDVNIGELVDWLKTHFKGSWKEFNLETTTHYQPSYPVWVDGTVTIPNVIINPTPYPVPAYPWQEPYYVSVGDNCTYDLDIKSSTGTVTADKYMAFTYTDN